MSSVSLDMSCLCCCDCYDCILLEIIVFVCKMQLWLVSSSVIFHTQEAPQMHVVNSKHTQHQKSFKKSRTYDVKFQHKRNKLVRVKGFT